MKMLRVVTVIVMALMAVVISLRPLVKTVIRHDRDTNVVSTLRTMHNAQAQFKAMKERFGTLKELADGDLIGPNYIIGKPVNRFIYTDANVSATTYCICANRTNDQAGNRDFNIIEDGEIRYHESETKGSAICGKGSSLSEGAEGKR